MKHLAVISWILIICGFVVNANAASSSPNRVSVGVRYHGTNEAVHVVPFGDNDISYSLAYEYHEDAGYWQIGVLYTPEIERDRSIDSVLTPYVNLIFTSDMWHLGVGILKSRVEQSDGSRWSDIYWQFITGLSIPFPGRISLTLYAFYVFAEWGDVFDDFDSDALEWGGTLSLSF